MIEEAGRLENLRVPPGNRLEALVGNRKHRHSIRIDNQWRVCFSGWMAMPTRSKLSITADGRGKAKPMPDFPPVHPDEILREEFLEPMGISAYRLAKDINVPQTRIAAILAGKRAITPDTALRL